jgi:hypothetical protein
VLGGRYQVMPVISLPTRRETAEMSSVALDVWDGRVKAVASVNLLPDEARELARRLVEAAHTADLR